MAREAPPALDDAAQALLDIDPKRAFRLAKSREDPRGLAICGCALAMLGEETHVADYLWAAGDRFAEEGDKIGRAYAEAVGAVATTRDRGVFRVRDPLLRAAMSLDRLRDREGAGWTRLLRARFAILSSGDGDHMDKDLAAITARYDFDPSPELATMLEIVRAEVTLWQRSGRSHALQRARSAAEKSAIPILLTMIERLERARTAPIATKTGGRKPVSLADVDDVPGDAFKINGLDRTLHLWGCEWRFRNWPDHYELLAELGRAWPRAASRARLEAALWGPKTIRRGRPPKLDAALAALRDSLGKRMRILDEPDGLRLEPVAPLDRKVSPVKVMLIEPLDEPRIASLKSLLDDGAGDTVPMLATRLGAPHAGVRKSLIELEKRGDLISYGKGRHKYWAMASQAEAFAAAMLVRRMLEPRAIPPKKKRKKKDEKDP